MENSNKNSDRQKLIAAEINQIRDRLAKFNQGEPTAIQDWKLGFLEAESEIVFADPEASVKSIAFASVVALVAKDLYGQINSAEKLPERKKPRYAIVDVASVMDEHLTMLERWQTEKRVGRVSYSEEFNAICFHFDTTSKKDRYWFYLSQMPTAESQMQWLNHLRDKGWFDSNYFNDFMEVLKLMGLVKEGLNY